MLSIAFQPPNLTSCLQVVASGGSVVGTLRPSPDTLTRASDVSIIVKDVLSYTALGEGYTKGLNLPITAGTPQDQEFAAGWWRLAGRAIQQGRVKASDSVWK